MRPRSSASTCRPCDSSWTWASRTDRAGVDLGALSGEASGLGVGFALLLLHLAGGPIDGLLHTGQAIPTLAVAVVELLADGCQFLANRFQLRFLLCQCRVLGHRGAGLQLALPLVELPAQGLGRLGLLPTVALDLLAAPVPDDPVGFQLARLFLQFAFAHLKSARAFVAGFRRRRLRGGRLDVNEEFDRPERDAVAVDEQGRGDGSAVDEDGLRRHQFAQEDAVGLAREQTEDRRQIGTGQAQVAAGHAADEEAEIRERIAAGPTAAVADVEAHLGPFRRRRPGKAASSLALRP